MLHVIQAIDSLHDSKGGPSRTVTQLSGALSAEPSTKVSIICNYASANHRQSIAGNIYLSLRREVAARSAAQVIVHDNGLWRGSNALAALAARVSQVPYVISPHGMLEPWAMGHHRHRKQLALALYQRWCLNNAAAFHATCAEEAVNVRSLGLKQPIAIIGNGIETVPTLTNKQPSKQRIALFLSRLHEKKGVLELISAWSRIRPQGWTLHIVGPDDGGHRRIAEKMIADHQLSGSVELRGEVNDEEKWVVYGQAELFVLPTHSENFGLVIGEALASGLPVITTTETPWKQIPYKKCGWIIKPNVDELCKALQEATNLSCEELLSMGEIGKRWIPTEFSWQRIAQQMREFYSWVVDGMNRSTAPDFVI